MNVHRNAFGIAFDIDGVLIRGSDTIGRAPDALRRLYKDVENGNNINLNLKQHFYFVGNILGMVAMNLLFAVVKFCRGAPCAVCISHQWYASHRLQLFN